MQFFEALLERIFRQSLTSEEKVKAFQSHNLNMPCQYFESLIKRMLCIHVTVERSF